MPQAPAPEFDYILTDSSEASVAVATAPEVPDGILVPSRNTFITQPIFDLKYYCNGFPKSGMHLLALLIRPLVEPLRNNGAFDLGIWSGTFAGFSWTEEWIPMERTTFKIGRMGAGQFMKGHSGYREDLAEFLRLLGVAHVFIYRDFRDVAVSQARHIMAADNVTLSHPEPELYRELGGFDEILEAVILGLGRYPGVMHRWEHFAPWLDVDWTLSVRYEDLLLDRRVWAEKILMFGLGRAPALFEAELNLNEEFVEKVLNAMVSTSEMTELSPTYREGSTGKWREHFNERHVELFKETDKNGWLAKLGYADW